MICEGVAIHLLLFPLALHLNLPNIHFSKLVPAIIFNERVSKDPILPHITKGILCLVSFYQRGNPSLWGGDVGGP